MAIHGQPTLAYLELKAVRNLPAFNIVGAKVTKLNQHARQYAFSDGSVLKITRHYIESYLSKGGLCDCSSYIHANTFDK
jgi:hypothetical protein